MNHNLIVCRLIQFRQEHEEDTDITEIEVPLPLALNDVCIHLGLTKDERHAVLGPRGTLFVETFLDQTADLPIAITLPVAQPATISRN